MKKATLRVETIVGVFTRETGSPYTHIVVWISPRAKKTLDAYAAGNEIGGGASQRWVKDLGYGVTWHSSLSAAIKASKKGYKWDNETSLVGVFEVQS